MVVVRWERALALELGQVRPDWVGRVEQERQAVLDWRRRVKL